MIKNYISAAMIGVAAISMTNCSMTEQKYTEREKALIELWTDTTTTPYGTMPFDKINDDDYLDALRLAMRIDKEEVQKVSECKDEPTFANTIAALERTGQMLSRIQYCLYNVASAETNDKIDDVTATIAPEEAEHSNSIYQDERLFARVKKVYEDIPNLNLTQEQKKLTEDTYRAFVKHGADLDSAKKEEFKKLSAELSKLTVEFGQEVLNSTNEYTLNITDTAKLKGLPETQMEAAKKTAESRGEQGWTFTLKYPSYFPFMKYIEDRELREKMYRAKGEVATKGDHSNIQRVYDIVEARRKVANMLGYNHYGEYVLENRMAKNYETVETFLKRLCDAYKPTALAEVDAVKKFAKETDGLTNLMPWDWSYYSEKLRERDYDINEEQIRPYLELERVKKGVFGLATKLYGIEFRKVTNIPVYHKEVETFEVYNEDGSFLAVLYTDFHPRDGKSGGAWMTEYKPQWKEDDGTDSRPHISIVMNFTRSTDSVPSLLSFDELTTFLHEFGHSLHGMMANSTYSSLSGTSVSRDFVELPSQMMENWAYEKEFLDSFAEHYNTGEKIPTELVEKIRRAANFNIGYQTLRQLSFGFLDLYMNCATREFKGEAIDKDILVRSVVNSDVAILAQYEDKFTKDVQLLPAVDGTLISTAFTHIFSGGYAVGYYGYKWAEVLDADAFAVFKREGLFNRETAKRFRTEVLEKGGTEDPALLFKRFKGSDYSIDALLERHGIKK